MNTISARRALLAAGAALILGGSALGLAAAQESPTPTPGTPGQSAQSRPSYQQFLEALARRLGIGTETLQQAITDTRAELGLPEGGMKFGFGPGRGGHGPGRGGMDLSVAAQAIGISAEQLRQELAGQSLAQVAQAHGVNPDTVASALENAANQRIDEAVAAGRVTAEQAAQLKQQAAEHIDQHMTRVKPQGGRGFRGGPSPSPSAPSSPTTSQPQI